MLRRRRYEVLQNPNDVREDVLRAIGKETLVHLDIHLTDIYEDGLEIPPDIENRAIDFNVVSISQMRGEQLRAFGFTSDKLAVNVAIPFDESARCVLLLLDKQSREP